jgi:hypothetical protein
MHRPRPRQPQHVCGVHEWRQTPLMRVSERRARSTGGRRESSRPAPASFDHGQRNATPQRRAEHRPQAHEHPTPRRATYGNRSRGG